MAKQERSERPKCERREDGKRSEYVCNNFPDHRSLARVIVWLDRILDFAPNTGIEAAAVDEINQSISKALELAYTLVEKHALSLKQRKNKLT
jgi:hypothetical protein